MVRIDVEYLGDLRCRATHAPSGAQLTTDAPVDNHGKGEAFSPTDSLAGSLATCMLTVMGIKARADGLDISGARATVDKEMTASPPRRVARLTVAVEVPAERASMLDVAARTGLEQAAEKCPVRLSLGDHVEVLTSYRWG